MLCSLSSSLTTTALQHIGKGMGDKWDYVVRRLFVKKATSLENCIGCAPSF
jgi:hypothetical protein